MKKIVLLLSVMMASFAAFAQSGTSWEDAIQFDWTSGNPQVANTTLWYEVNLNNVTPGDNVVLYLNNETDGAATVSALPIMVVEKYGTTSIVELTEETTRTIAARRHAALEIASTIIENLATKIIYVKLTTDTEITFAAEAVEPGEVNLECLDATLFDWAGTTHNARVKKWYKIDIEDIIADPTKSIRVNITNQGTATANVTAGLSFDCPSTGTTDRALSIAAGATRTWDLTRAQINMLGVDMIYLLLDSDQKLQMTANEITVASEPTYNVTGATAVALETEYTQAAGEQWYKVELADLDVARHLPEITLEGGATVAHIDAVLVYEEVDATGLTRSLTLGANAVLVKEIQRNLIETAVAQSPTGYAYIRLTTDAPFTFSVRVKARTEGTACEKAQDFAIGGTINHVGKEETAWYALDIKAAKADATKDIELTIENRGAQAVTILGQVALSCPYTSTTDATRTIAANTTMTKVLSNSLYSNLKSDTIYIGLTAEQNLIVSAKYVAATDVTPDDACETAKEFNLDGEVIAAGESWYKVYVKDFVANEQVPEITVANNSGVTATITAEVSLVCPATNTQSRTITLPDGDRYVKTPALNLLEAISGDYVYVKVTTNTEISVKAEVKYEEAGVSCAKPIEFNWTVGHDQAADTQLWYAVNIKDAKDNDKALELAVKNLEGEEAEITVDVAFDCPVTDVTSRTITLAGNTTQVKTAANSLIANLKNDVIYVLVSTTRNIHLGATQVDDVPAVSDPACLAAVEFDWTNGHDQLAGTTWYKIARTDIEKEGFVPQINVKNNGAAQANVKAGFAFACDATPTTKAANIAAGVTASKKIDKALIEGYTFDTLYIQVITTQDIHITAEWIDANQGEDCFKAIEFDWTKGHLQGAGEEKWYKIDITAFKADPQLACEIGIANQDGYAGLTKAELYFPNASACDQDLFGEYNYTLAANGRRTLPINNATIGNLKSDVIYLKLFTAQEDSIFATLETEPVIVTDFCDKIQPFFFNTLISQEGDAEGKWYAINVKEALLLDENALGAELIIVNSDAENTFVAEVAYNCPATTKLDDKTRVLAANATDTIKIERALLENLTSEFIYIHVTGSADFQFIVKIQTDLGVDCSKPIVFDWKNGNVNPAGAELWYRIELTDSLAAHPGKDIRLIVENLADVDATAIFTIKGDCGDEPLRKNVTKTLAANGLEAQVVSTLALETFERVHVLLSTTENVHLRAEFVEPVIFVEYGTREYFGGVCVGDEFTYQVADSIFTKRLDSRYNSWVFVDTVRTTIGIDAVDSIMTTTVHPIQLPAWESVTTLPVAVAGEAIDVTAASADLLKAFNDAWAAGDAIHQDTTAQVTSITWKVLNENGVLKDLTANPVPFTADEIVMAYVINGTQCVLDDGGVDAPNTLLIPVNLEANRVYETIDSIVCVGSDITLKSGNVATIDANTTLNDTVTTATQQFIYTYKFLVYLDFTLPDVTANIRLNNGAPIDTANAEAQIRLSILEQKAKNSLIVDYDQIIWEGKTVSATTWGNLPAFLQTNEDYMIRYSVTTACGKTIVPASGDMTFQIDGEVTPKPVFKVETTQYVCPNTVVAGVSVTADTTWTAVKEFDYTVYQKADSVFVYHVYIKKQPTTSLNILPVAQAGFALDLTASTDELLGQLALNDPEKTAEINGDITWTMNGAPLPVTRLDKNLTEIKIAYAFNTCVGTFQSPEYTVAVAPIIVVNGEEDHGYFCAGEEVNGQTITADATWTELTTVEGPTYTYDSITTHYAFVKEALVLPAIEVEPIAVCGKVLDVAEATAALEAEFATLDPETQETVATIAWFVNGTAADQVTLKADGTVYNVTYKVTTSCSAVEIESAPVQVTVEAQTYENDNTLKGQNIINQKYNYRLLLVNVPAVKDLNNIDELAEEQVTWYRKGTNGNDTQVGTGFYLTSPDGEQLVGTYYVIIDLGQETVADEYGCSKVITSNEIESVAVDVVGVAPNMVAPGEQMVISGLNAEETYTIEVYNLMGVMVDSFNVSGVTSYTLEAQALAGYYMIDVQVNAVKTASLKYIVK